MNGKCSGKCCCCFFSNIHIVNDIYNLVTYILLLAHTVNKDITLQVDFKVPPKEMAFSIQA